MVSEVVLFPCIIRTKKYLLVFNLRKKVINIWDDMRVSKRENFHFWVNCHFEEQDVMQRLETYSRQNTRICCINEESHRININVLIGHFLCVVYSTSLYERIINPLIVYLGH